MGHLSHERDLDHAARSRAASAPLLDQATESELLRRIRDEEDARALEALLASHLRLVVSIATRFARAGLSMSELVSEGNLGLVEAARRFDPAKNARYATYAVWWVRSYVARYALANRRIVPGPSTRHARKLYASMRTAERELERLHGTAPTREELAAATGTSVEDVALVQLSLSCVDATVGSQDDGCFEPVATAPTPEDELADLEHARLRAERVRAAMAVLDARERLVVRRRLLAEDDPTLATVGIELGLSRERIRQIEASAKEKLRSVLAREAA